MSHLILFKFVFSVFITKGLGTILLDKALVNHQLGLNIYNNNQDFREWGNIRKNSKLVPPLNVYVRKWSSLETGVWLKIAPRWLKGSRIMF